MLEAKHWEREQKGYWGFSIGQGHSRNSGGSLLDKKNTGIRSAGVQQKYRRLIIGQVKQKYYRTSAELGYRSAGYK